MSNICGICTDSFKNNELNRVCGCHSYCESCLEAEGNQVFQNRGSPTELTRMLNCTTCGESKDIEIYPLSDSHKRQIIESTVERNDHAESSQENDESDDDDIGIYHNRCPGCNIRIEKDGGCNHMTHRRCPGRRDVDVHFCDCCNKEIYQMDGYWEDDEGKNHFPDGVFSNCIIVEHNNDDDDDEDQHINNFQIGDRVSGFDFNGEQFYGPILRWSNNGNPVINISNNNYVNEKTLVYNSIYLIDNENDNDDDNDENDNDDDDDENDNFQVGDRVSGFDFNGEQFYGPILRWSNNGNPVINISNNNYVTERTLVYNTIHLIDSIQNICCFNCNQNGHYRNNCPYIQCFRCSGYGHIAGICAN